MYVATNPGRVCHCVVCNRPVESVSAPLPVGKIGDIVQRIRDEREALNDSLHWNDRISSPHQHLHNPAPEGETVLFDRKSEQVIYTPTRSPTVPPTVPSYTSVWETESVWEDEAKERDKSRRSISPQDSASQIGKLGERSYRTDTTAGDLVFSSQRAVESERSSIQLTKLELFSTPELPQDTEDKSLLLSSTFIVHPCSL